MTKLSKPVVLAAAAAAALGLLLWQRRRRSAKKAAPRFAACGLPLPPFRWDVTVAEIEAFAASVLADAAANLDAVADARSPPTFANVIRPLMLQPNYKTNPALCNAKFLQHCSTDPALRAAAEAAGKQFAAFKAASRRREDVFARVKAFAATAEAESLAPHDAHFVAALLADFTRGGLALDAAGRAELQRLLDADSDVCARFGANLGNDKTKVRPRSASDDRAARRRGARRGGLPSRNLV